MDFSRLRQGEIVAGIGGIALILFLFFDWFEGTSGWSAYGGDVTGFIIALAAFTAVKFTGLAAMGKRLNIPVPRGGITLVLGTLAVLIIIWSIFVTEGEDIKFGLFLGLAAAVAIAVGALMALREGGWEPLVDAGDSRRAAGTASTTSTASTDSTATTRRAASSGSSTKKPAAKKKTAAKKRAAKRSAS